MIFKKQITIIGGGVAAMMLASELDSDIFDINIYEKGSGLGKKFLVAGKGGFNLTHSEPMESFIRKYEPSSFLKPFLQKFDNKDLRIWFENIGIPTMIGSSKKVYPVKGIKPVKVLSAIKGLLDKNNVTIHYKHKFIRIQPDGKPVFETEGKIISISSDIVVFALGGASWSVTGSDGKWLNILKESGVLTKIFEPSNCAFEVDWDGDFITKYEGKPLKNIAVKTGEKYVRGELMITRFGLEGGAIFAMSGELRKALKGNNRTSI
ncbi:MAG: aminoacetone oxidase family FAD-binding enzyme, partial [Bacteroidetes bacterium]